jgi:predicted small secreted protein
LAVLSNKNFINNLENFFGDINSSNGCYYVFAARTTPWPNDSSPPTANVSYNEVEQSIYHDLVFGKQITNNNIAYLVPNIPWVNNTIYAQYDANSSTLQQSTCYVVTSTYSVYKCIDNNYGANSIVQPTITPTVGTFETSDGYTWKYMFTIPTNANSLFTSNKYIPVVANTFVSNGAIPGSIDVIRVLNGGYGWEGYANGYVSSVLSTTTLKLGAGAVPIDNFYTGSSIYLNAGLGASQIRLITGYTGATQTVVVSPAFNAFVNLYLNNASITGSFILGETVAQSIAQINFVYESGTYNVNDFLVQSDTLASGYISHSNSTLIQLHQANVSSFGVGSNAYPVYNTSDSGVLQTGYVTITSGSNTITATTANLLTLAVNNFVQIGNNANLNIRRITSITNSSVAHVSLPFNNNLTANVFYNILNAFEPTSETILTSYGAITQVNLNSMKVNFANASSNNLSFILGETVKEYNANGVDQSANATISFANSTTLILSNINGILTGGLFLVGQSSTLQAQISNIITYPNITLSGSLGTFVTGDTVYAYYANGGVSGSATVLSYSYTPSGTTQYIISPTVNIIGDGYGAQAYSVVNTAIGANFSVDDIVMINTGVGYTNASATLSANSLWGNNASLQPVISPVEGHGYNPIEELGARYAGISLTFDTASNESYYFPSYGSYRRVGIIKNPLYNSLAVNYATPKRMNLTVQSVSGVFVNNEIILQYSTNAAALVKVTNSTFMQLDNINGTFTSNASNSTQNNMIVGLTSGATSNVVTANVINFSFNSNTQTIYELNTSANGLLTQVVNSSQLVLTNVNGKFLSNAVMYDPSTNAYANVISILTSNGTTNASSTFGLRFNQTSRVTLSSNTNIPFKVGEYVNQATSNASGLVISTTGELDLIYSSGSGSFSVGTTLTDANTSATAIINFANNNYIKLTGVSGTFNNGDKITNITGNAIISAVQTVLLLGDIQNQYPFQIGNYTITGNTSGATGLNGVANTIQYPDLIRNSGDTIYINDVTPFTLDLTSKEVFQIVIQL